MAQVGAAHGDTVAQGASKRQLRERAVFEHRAIRRLRKRLRRRIPFLALGRGTFNPAPKLRPRGGARQLREHREARLTRAQLLVQTCHILCRAQELFPCRIAPKGSIIVGRAERHTVVGQSGFRRLLALRCCARRRCGRSSRRRRRCARRRRRTCRQSRLCRAVQHAKSCTEAGELLSTISRKSHLTFTHLSVPRHY